MAEPIEDEGQARALARAIVADLVLYNRARLGDGRDLAAVLPEEVAEGRALFQGRAAERLHPIFEQALEAWDAPGGEGGGAGWRPAGRAAASGARDEPRPPATGPGSPAALIGVLALAVAAAAAFWFLRGGR